MSGLRFAFLTTFYPPYNFGGDGIGIQRLARGLVRAGHHVTVIHDADAYLSLAKGPPPTGEPEPDGLEVVSLRSRLGVVSPLLTQQTGRPITCRRACAAVHRIGRGPRRVFQTFCIAPVEGEALREIGSERRII